ncbi:MAG: CDP-diacylglycerol--glycerol-3-phosphate 3-phosphatidyltransferase [Peptococcaceae bacterium]|jgi:CDP-diacylglycerol--glycerol-3-phosphate 3-phosphatidyltransferase|nr:CDP-diacylglycerol--glycerol-3-phosphate 3-phosphatidyltransferase [Peptococcaceae bacterium]
MNLANKLTMLRIALIPPFMFFVLTNQMLYHDFAAVLIFVLAASTDGLDGYIARKRRQVTNLGKLLDPLADKLLVAAGLIALVEVGRVPAWVATVIIGREFLVTGLRGIAAAEGVVIAASVLGKIKTCSQIAALAALLLDDYLRLWLGLPLGVWVLYIALAFTVYSGYDYISKTFRQIRMV